MTERKASAEADPFFVQNDKFLKRKIALKYDFGLALCAGD